MILHSYGNAAYTVQYSYQYTFFHLHLNANACSSSVHAEEECRSAPFLANKAR